MLRTTKTDTQLTVAPPAAGLSAPASNQTDSSCVFFSRQTPSTFFEQNSPTLTVSLFDFALASGLFITAAFGQPDILSPAAVLTAVAVSGCSLLTKFRLTGESTDIPPRSAPQHPYLLRPVPPAEKRLRQNHYSARSEPYRIRHRDRIRLPPQTITFPDVF